MPALLSIVLATSMVSQLPIQLDPAMTEILGFWFLDRYRQDGGYGPMFAWPTLHDRVVAKAQPDECFTRIGGPILPIGDDGECAVGTPKVNQSYVWGLVRAGDYVWFGTVSNTMCLATGAVPSDLGPQMNTPFLVCEHQESQSGTGDWRRPHLYRYSLRTRMLEDMSPPEGSPAGELLSTTTGIRSAGTINGIVLLGGPAFVNDGSPISSEGTGGINLFAFDARTGALLGAKRLDQYSNIRSFLAYRGVLYTTVGNTMTNPAQPPGGSVLRYRGYRSSGNPDLLFRFEVVGHLPTQGASLALHQGRLFVSTWPTLDMRNPWASVPSGLVMGPVIPSCGLTGANAHDWTTIWQVTQYEPEPVLIPSLMGGALASFKGDLYWATMQAPGTGMAFAMAAHMMGLIDLDGDDDGQLDAMEAMTTMFAATRPTTLFRLRGDIGAMKPAERLARTEILYGERYFPVYDSSARAFTIAFDGAHSNRMPAPRPKLGASGFGNFFNTYSWAMQVYRDQLFVGTIDFSYSLRGMMQQMLAGGGGAAMTLIDQVLNEITFPWEGADLLRIPWSTGRAYAETLDGFGNAANSGVRNMTVVDDSLFVGTANQLNLHPDGGWELIRLWR